MFTPFHFLGGAFLGWSIGGMDFAALFGAAISAKMVRYWHGVAFACIFCILGCLLQGGQGIETISKLTIQNINTALISSIAAAAAITILNIFKLPVPTSQAVVGGIAGIAIMTGNFQIGSFAKVISCWIATPLAGFVLAIPIYLILGTIINRFNFNIFQRDAFYRISLIFVGCYTSYAMGANTVANVGAVFVGAKVLNSFQAALFGGIFILIGIITFSKRVIGTVGSGIIKLDAFSSLSAVLTEAITAHFFACIGVPVSMTQALIGAIVGIGIVRGFKSIRVGNLGRILAGWIIMPIFACIMCLIIYSLVKFIWPMWI